MNRAAHQTMHRLPNDPAAGDQQKDGFKERREIFQLPVTIPMVFVRRLVGNRHRKIGDQRRKKIQARVSCLGKYTQAIRHKTDG